ncbi:MAG: glycoside-pentoside-hexuronide (GPH):cation symporter [Steroidobacteraceae bacterium]
MSNPPSEPSSRLPLSLCLAFGLGTNGTATLIGVTGIYLLFFMTTMLGIEPALAGALIFASKIYDLVTDPLMGYVSDRTRSRIGRRRPYLLLGAVVAALSAWLLFDVPAFASETATIVWYGGVLLLFATGYTIFSVPYLSMPAEMTSDYHDRTRLMSFRTLFSSVGLLIGTAIAPIIVSSGGGATSAPTVLRPPGGIDCVLPPGRAGQVAGTPEGYALMGTVIAVVVFVSMALCFLGTRRARFAMPQAVATNFAEQVRMTFRNRPFMLLVATKTLQLTGVTAFSAGLAFFAQYVVQLTGAQLGMFFGLFSLGTILSLPGWVWHARRAGKKAAYLLAVLAFVCLDLGLLLVGEGDLGLLLALGFLIGLSSGGLILLGVSMLPDTIDYDHHLTGQRREGIYAGVWSTIEKGSAAVATLFAGAILSGAGYLETRAGEIACQPQSALTAIQLNVAVLPATVMLLSLLFLTRYDLTRERLEELAAGRR